jgi:hypothetical protein
MVYQVFGKSYGTLIVTQDQSALHIFAPDILQELP